MRNRLSHCPEQDFVVEWLRQEFQSPSLHGSYRHRHITVTSDEDDWQVRPIGDALLQFQTVEVGKCDVEYETAWSWHRAISHEFVCRGEGLCLPACGVDQQSQRFSHRGVIVHDEHNG